MKRALCIFAKEPALGRTKTRLAATIGDELACRLSEAFLRDTIERFASLSPTIWFASDTSWSPTWLYGFERCVQPQVDLGTRMKTALESHFHSADAVVIIGSDAATLPQKYVEQAFSSLVDHDLVFGPSHDGGYYLLGATSSALMFSNVIWSTDNVLHRSIQANQHLRSALLPPWFDVDFLSDLRILKNQLTLDPSLAPNTADILLTESIDFE